MKTIISYILIFALITLFALFLDATGGLFVLIIFLSAIALSTALHIYAVRLFDCHIEINTQLAEKGEEIRLTARIPKAPFFLPTVFEVTFGLSYHLDCPDCVYSATLSRREGEFSCILTPKFFGKATISITKIKATDILGIFSPFFRTYLLNKVSNADKTKQALPVKIFPSVPDLSKSSEFVRTLEDASAYDDNEQSREIPYAVTGFPGYEHRDYVPGDSLKSINWKLSAKRDRLLTRKPEAYAGGDMVLILDASESKAAGLTARVNEQLALEALLALAEILIKQEILCRVYVRFADGWGVTPLTSLSDLEKLRYALTEYSYSDYSDTLPDLSDEKAGSFVVFNSQPAGVILESDTFCDKERWQIEETDGEIMFIRGN